MNLKTALLGFALLAGISPSLYADLLGAQVTGTLNFPRDTFPTKNYFDPTFLYVPPNYGNSGPNGSPTVIITSPTYEFGYADAYNNDSADFDGNSLTIRDSSLIAGAGPWVMTFTSTAFNGLAITPGLDTFPNGLAADLAGDTLTVTFSGSNANFFGQASFDFGPPITSSAVPEPGSLILLASAAGLLALKLRRQVAPQ